jgi:predicted deacylase
MFLEFVNNKKAKNFNEDLAKATNGYCELMQIGTKDQEQIFKVVINPNAKKSICFVSGLHGNEEGSSEGVLAFLKDRPFIHKNKRVIIIPLANPTGLNKGTRKNADNVDINRHFLDDILNDECKYIWDALKEDKINLLCSLHEDPDLKTFYCYYTHHLQLAKDLRTLAEKYFKIYSKSNRKPLDGEEQTLYDDKIYNGLIQLPHTVRGTIEDKFLLERDTPYITIESPGKVSLDKRTEFNKKAMKLVINSAFE